ncbi:MAG: hypothetical protein ACRDG7_11730 [Candidatus Limnocylindria bacterium]
MSMSADTRLYAGAIALVSGIYSIGSAIAGGMAMMPMNDSVMLLVGIVVIAHGIVLLTPLAERLGRASGPLMVVWAAVMLANQLLATTMSSGSMMVSWDPGMVAVAVLMLASGLIMRRSREPM